MKVEKRTMEELMQEYCGHSETKGKRRIRKNLPKKTYRVIKCSESEAERDLEKILEMPYKYKKRKKRK